MRGDGGDRRRLAGGDPIGDNPWSPDSRRIALVHLTTGRLATIRADGSDFVPLGDVRVPVDERVTWSPNSRALAFTFDPRTAGIYLASDSTETATPVLVTPGARATQPDWSRDGRKLVFLRGTATRSNVFVADADGSNVLQLTLMSTRETNPAWSPDATRIAFSSDRDGDWEIYVVNADGTGVRRLTSSRGVDAAPSWSPDGTKIAFQSSRFGLSEIMTVGSEGGEAVRVTADERASIQPDWAPDGSKLAYTSGGDITLIRPDGTGRSALTRGPEADASARWSRTGDRIAFVRDSSIRAIAADGTDAATVYDGGGDVLSPSWTVSGRIGFSIEHWRDVGVVDIRTGVRRAITSTPSFEREPQWSPGGRELAFVSASRLVTQDLGRGTQRVIARDVGTFSWSPSGEFFAVLTAHRFARVRRNGSALTPLVAGSDVTWAWSPRTGRLAYARARPRARLTVVVVDRRGRRTIVARGSRSGHLAELSWSPDGRMIAYTDGVTVGEGRASVYVADVALRRRRLMTSGFPPGSSNHSPGWARIGR